MGVRFKWGRCFIGVKDVAFFLMKFLPKALLATRGLNYVPIKNKIFCLEGFPDRLPIDPITHIVGVLVSGLLCPLCSSAQRKILTRVLQLLVGSDIVRPSYALVAIYLDAPWFIC
ncbi:hypothetical protein Tco_1429086 [Tanacetum coccineum]